MNPKRNCGPCRECCIVLDVEALAKPADSPCDHLCGDGCAIYDLRPESCRVFTCAWKEGLLAHSDRPSKTHMVVWQTKMASPTGGEMEVLQCNVRAGFKVHKKTMRHLRVWSFKMPVLVVQSEVCTMMHFGRNVGTWRQEQFVELKMNNLQIVGLTVREREEVFGSPELERRYRSKVARNVEVVETDPKYRKTQLQYLQEDL